MGCWFRKQDGEWLCVNHGKPPMAVGQMCPDGRVAWNEPAVKSVAQA